MAIFDTNKKVYLTFNIVLTDPAAVVANQALYPTGVNMAPFGGLVPLGGAATVFAAPWRGYAQPAMGTAPFSWSPWSGEGEEDGPYPLNVATFQRHTGGFLGMGGTTIRYYWMGMFTLAATDGSSNDYIPIQAIVPTRHFIEGFEYPNLGPGTCPNTGGIFYSPDASRHAGGLGLAIRGATSQYTATTIFYGHAPTNKCWQRFYIRLRQRPSNLVYFYINANSVSSSLGLVLGVSATGEVIIATRNSGGVYTVHGGTGVTLVPWTGLADDDAWHKVDLLIGATVLGAATLRVMIDTRPVNNGMGAINPGAGNLASTSFGDPSATANDLFLDVDDFMQADIPSLIGDPLTENLNSRDYINGTKIVAVHPTTLSPNHSVNWVGDVRVLRQNPCGASVSTPEIMTATVALSLAAALCDDALTITADAGAVGVASLAVVALSKKPSGLSGRLGYSLAGAAAAMTNITQGATPTANGVLYAGPAAADLPVVTPLELRHDKGNDAVASTLYSLGAQAELVGKWSECDVQWDVLLNLVDRPVNIPLTPQSAGVHNTPYPRSPWSTVGLAPPISPYIVKGGLYTGNGTGQDLVFRAPVHTFFVRPVTGNTGGYWWMSTMLGSHRAFQEGITGQIQAEEDPTFNGAPGEDQQTLQYRIRIPGLHTQLNAVGVAYQYIAIMDPGMRYSTGVALTHKAAAGPTTWKLNNPTFAPGFALLHLENASATSTARLYGKDAGQASASIANFAGGGAITPALTFGIGEIITDIGLHALVPSHHGMMLWRKQDGNNDTGEAGVVNFGSYVGDGAASRTINLAPASGRRPLFAIVMAETGTSRWRDPSHTSTGSSQPSGSEAATGITAGGIDSFTVGVGLNATGVTHIYFVLFADATACNNGWGCNGEYAPVEPNSPVGGGPYPPEPPEPGTGGPEPPTGPAGTPGPCPPGDPDCVGPEITVECKEGTKALFNRALSRIGVSRRVLDVTTDLSVENDTALLHYGLDINQTLRGYPWSFATRYADLVLVAGTSSVPATADWQYAYRAPGDMLFARRLVGQAYQGRDYDPDPIKFRLGSDSVGGLIYTDAALQTDVALVLEYTVRPACAGSVNDALFREALTWRLAASLAGPLTRDPKKMEFCLMMYQRTLDQARAADANEQQQDPTGDADWITGRD